MSLIAWRLWRCAEGELHSLHMSSTVWTPGEPLHAECMARAWVYEPHTPTFLLKHGEEALPANGCTCGIHAYKSKPQAPGYDIVGEVELWGRVVEHELGYRAEYARPVSLYVLPFINLNPAWDEIRRDK